MQQARERLSSARRGDRPCPSQRLPTSPSPTGPASTRRSPTVSSASSNKAASRGCSLGRSAGGVSAPLGLPRNSATGRSYSGINILILWSAVAERGFTGQNWLTFRQTLKLGAHVRKGEKGTTVVYADRFIPYRERTRAAEAGDEPEAIPFLKRFTVFNADQCEDLPADIAPAAVPTAENLTLPQAEALIRATGADIRIGGDRAFYVPSADYIQVPPPSAYFEPINWHRTVFHELGHHTGHPSRLNRDLSGNFGSSSYAREELCAEMAAPSSVRRSASCRPFGMLITSAPGSTS